MHTSANRLLSLKTLILIAFSLTLWSCNKQSKTVEFKKLADFDLGNISKSTATLSGVAVFMNLTDEEYSVKDLILDLSVDGKNVGTLVMKPNKTIQPRSEFSIPLSYTYETKSFLEQGRDPSNTYAVELLGNLTLKNKNKEELTSPVKFATTYAYKTRKEIRTEKREERRELRKARKNGQ